MISSKNSPRTVVSSRLAYTRAHACQDTTEPGVETRRAALRRLVALHYYDIRHAWPALTIKPLFHLADWRGPESICQNVWCRIHSHNAWFPFCFRGAAAFFFFNDSEIDRVCEFLIFFLVHLLVDSSVLQLVFRISYGGLKRDNRIEFCIIQNNRGNPFEMKYRADSMEL